MRQHLIEVLGLKKSFHGTAVLRGFDLAVDGSQLTVLIGQSGCGKSRLLRCLNGLETFDEGTIPSRRSTVPYEAPGPPVAEHRMTLAGATRGRCALLSTPMGTKEVPLKTQARSSAPRSSPIASRTGLSPNLSGPSGLIYAILLPAPKSNFLFLYSLFLYSSLEPGIETRPYLAAARSAVRHRAGQCWRRSGRNGGRRLLVQQSYRLG